MKRKRETEPNFSNHQRNKRLKLENENLCSIFLKTTSTDLVLEHVSNNTPNKCTFRTNGISIFIVIHPSNLIYRANHSESKYLLNDLRVLFLTEDFFIRRNNKTETNFLSPIESLQTKPLLPTEKITFKGSLRDISFIIICSCGDWYDREDKSLKESVLLIENKLGKCDILPENNPKDQFALIFLGSDPSVRVRRRGVEAVIDIRSNNKFAFLDDAIRYQANCDQLQFIQFRTRLEVNEWRNTYRESIREQAQKETKMIDQRNTFELNIRHYKGGSIKLEVHYQLTVNHIRGLVKKALETKDEEILTLFFSGMILFDGSKRLLDYYVCGLGKKSNIWVFIERPSQSIPPPNNQINDIIIPPPPPQRTPPNQNIPRLPGLPTPTGRGQEEEEEEEGEDLGSEEDLLEELRKKSGMVNLDFMEDEEFYGEVQSNNLDIFEQSLRNEKDSLQMYISREEKMSLVLNRFGYTFTPTNIPSDGNCMFSSISDQLYKTTQHSLKIRKFVVDWLRKNSRVKLENGEEIRSFLNKTRYKSWEGFLEAMSKEGEWGNFLCLRAAASVFRVTVVLVSDVKDGSVTLIKPVGFSSSKIISICHFHEFHYRSIKEQNI